MGDVIDLNKERAKRELIGDLARGRPPVASEDFLTRMLKLKESLDKIDALMKNLKGTKDEK